MFMEGTKVISMFTEGTKVRPITTANIADGLEHLGVLALTNLYGRVSKVLWFGKGEGRIEATKG